MLRDLVKSTKGQTLVEYAILIVGIAIIVGLAVVILGPMIGDLFGETLDHPDEGEILLS